MKHYGLIGYPLTHSFSEDYFREKFLSSNIAADYQNFPINDLEALPELIKLHHLDGFNVTIPYKERVVKYLDKIDDHAKMIKAVNCVKVKDGKLTGYNTDVIGFEQSLSNFLSSSHHNNHQKGTAFKNTKHIKALVFGNGGASKAVIFVLRKLKIDCTLVSRNDLKDSIMYSDLNAAIFKEYKLLINTTPVGMYPDISHKIPIPYALIDDTHFAFDLIYNPEKTSFLSDCEKEGAQIKNGYEMLIIQAEESYKIFTQ